MRRCFLLWAVLALALLSLGGLWQAGFDGARRSKALGEEASRAEAAIEGQSLVFDAGSRADRPEEISSTAPPAAAAEIARNSSSEWELEFLQGFFGLLCNISRSQNGTGILHQVRALPYEQRERIIEYLAPGVEKVVAPLEMPTWPPFRANCRAPKLFPVLLTGEKRKEPAMVVDLPSGMGGGPELDLLELRLLNLQGVADLTVAAESGYNFRGDRKPRLLRRNLQRFQDFASLLYLDLDNCTHFAKRVQLVRSKRNQAQNLWDIQDAQRACLWKTLRNLSLPDSALVVFTDLDEIPSRETIQTLKHCEIRSDRKQVFQIQQHTLTRSLRQASLTGPSCMQSPWLQGVVTTFRWAQDHNVSLRMRPKADLMGGATHFSHFGTAAAIFWKGLSHGEGGSLSLPLERYNFCDLAGSPSQVSGLVARLRDDPVSILRWWMNRSRPLPKNISMDQLMRCQVPWPLLKNPRRFRAFWG